MRILTIMLVLLLTSNGAWAEWEKVSEVAGADHYIDPATVRKDGELRKVWSILNLQKRHADGEMSRRVRYEFDCNKERVRILSMSTHSKPMADGQTIEALGEDPYGWRDVPPGTASETILKKVCVK